PRGVLGGQRAFHRLGEAAGNSKSKTHAVTAWSIAETLERREDPVLRVVGDAGATVDQPELKPGPDDASARDDLRAAGGGLESVLQDVDQHPVEQTGVATQQREVIGEPGADPAALVAEAGDGSGDDIPEVQILEVRSDRSGLQPRHVEQVAHHGVEPVGRLVDRLEKMASSSADHVMSC